MIDFEYDDEYGTVTCRIFYKDLKFAGFAKCNPEDNYKRQVGEMIAGARAEIEYLKFVLNCELQPAYAALKQLFYSVNQSKNYNEHSYEARAIRRQMYQKEADIEYIKEEILNRKDYLKGIFKAMEAYEKVDKEG